MCIETFVFFDINTVGYTAENKKNIKLVEFTMMAVTRNAMSETPGDVLPPMQHMYRLINPQTVVDIDRIYNNTGLSIHDLMQRPAFENIVEDINNFLENLSMPVCLVSSKGNKLDFKVLKSEYEKAESNLPPNLLCVVVRDFFIDQVYESLTVEHGLDPLFANMAIKGLKAKFLTTLYQYLFRSEPSKSKRTDARAKMLLKCVINRQNTFLAWADEKAELIESVRPYEPDQPDQPDQPDWDVSFENNL